MTSDGTLTDHVRQAGRSTVRRHVAASCEQVFEVVSSGWLYPVWVVGAARMRAVDPGWPAVGSKLHHSVGLWPALLDDETEVLVCEPPRRIVLQARGWPVGEATVDLHLDPDPDDPDGACTASLGEDASHGPGRFVPPGWFLLVGRWRGGGAGWSRGWGPVGGTGRARLVRRRCAGAGRR